MTSQNINLNSIKAALGEFGDPWEAGVTSVSVLSAAEQKKICGVTPLREKPPWPILRPCWPPKRKVLEMPP